MMEFFCSEEEVNQLIDIIQKHPYLYRSDDEKYKDVNMKARVWKEIAEAMGKTEEACKSKWKSLRDWYVRKKKDGKLPTGPGPASARIRTRYKLMGFLDDDPDAFLEDDTGSTTAIDCAVEIEDADDSGSFETYSDEEYKPSRLPTARPRRLQTSPQNTNPLKIVKTPDGRKLRRVRPPEGQIFHESPRETTVQPCTRLDSDEFEKFFSAMATSTRQLPRDLQISVKEDVTRIIFAAEREANKRECSFMQPQQDCNERVKRRKN